MEGPQGVYEIVTHEMMDLTVLSFHYESYQALQP